MFPSLVNAPFPLSGWCLKRKCSFSLSVPLSGGMNPYLLLLLLQMDRLDRRNQKGNTKVLGGLFEKFWTGSRAGSITALLKPLEKDDPWKTEE